MRATQLGSAHSNQARSELFLRQQERASPGWPAFAGHDSLVCDSNRSQLTLKAVRDFQRGVGAAPADGRDVLPDFVGHLEDARIPAPHREFGNAQLGGKIGLPIRAEERLSRDAKFFPAVQSRTRCAACFPDRSFVRNTGRAARALAPPLDCRRPIGLATTQRIYCKCRTKVSDLEQIAY